MTAPLASARLARFNRLMTWVKGLLLALAFAAFSALQAYLDSCPCSAPAPARASLDSPGLPRLPYSQLDRLVRSWLAGRR